MTKSKSGTFFFFIMAAIFTPLLLNSNSSYLLLRDSIFGQKTSKSAKAMTQIGKPGGHG